MQLPFAAVTVPIDASATAQHAIDYVLHGATAPATLHFCSVVDPSQVTARIPYPISDARPFLDGSAREAARLCRDAVAKARQRGVTGDCAILIGNPAEAIARYALENRSEAIVLCTHGRHGMALIASPSVAQRLLHHAHVPIVAVHAADARARDGPVVCAVDGSARAGDVVRAALTVAARSKRPLSVVHVVDARDAWDDAAPILERAADAVRAAGIEFELVTLRGRPAATILEHAEKIASPAIVSGTRGRGAVARAVLGSVAAELVEDAVVPVVIVPPPTREDRPNGAFTRNA